MTNDDLFGAVTRRIASRISGSFRRGVAHQWSGAATPCASLRVPQIVKADVAIKATTLVENSDIVSANYIVTLVRDRQDGFVVLHSAHGDGQTQTQPTAEPVGRDHRASDGGESPVLRAIESAVARAGVRRLRRRPVCVVLRRHDGSARSATGHLFPPAVDWLLRGHR